MATSITTDIVTQRTGFRFTTGWDLLTVEATGSLTSLTRFGIHSTKEASWVRLFGDVRADTAAAIYMAGAGAKLDVAAGAVVSSGVNATYLAGVALTGGGAQVTNAGTITASVAGALTVEGVGAQIGNSGTISGGSFGVFLYATGSVLANSGVISCSGGDFNWAAIRVWYNDAQIQNSGTIAATAAGVAGILVGGQVGGPARILQAGMIENDGMISSAAGYGIILGGSIAGFQYELINSGTVAGHLVSYVGSSGVDRILNTGLMVGDVVLGHGDDVFDGVGGTVQGALRGGAGNDIYRLSDAAQVVVELAGEGRDRIEATVSFDLTGREGVEVLALLGDADIDATGNEAANTILGNVGANVISGAGGYDDLSGGKGDDVVAGGDGEDQLAGGAGHDALEGGNGDDRITGGVGTDSMAGGAGADVFLFAGWRDSRSGERADVITDFTSGLDRINLAAIDADALSPGDQGFVFIGGDAFGAVAGQVRYGGGVLELDIDGDGQADLQIILEGAPDLAGSDLSL